MGQGLGPPVAADTPGAGDGSGAPRRGGSRPADPGEDDDQLFARLYPALRRFAAAVAPREIDPDDLLQEATARALRRGPLVQLDNPEAYLRRAIVNLASNERRRLGRWRRARGRLAATTDDTTTSYPSDVSDLLALPAPARAVLWLADVEGWTFDQVAELLGCSPEAARARASRARWALRHLLEGEEHPTAPGPDPEGGRR
jgi:RNA polymerase sigma factor (sigma-70 family)